MRSFHRSVIQFEVLSEEPISDGATLESIAYECNEGRYIGRFLPTSDAYVVSGAEMARLLQEAGSDPGFFELDDKGEDAPID